MDETTPTPLLRDGILNFQITFLLSASFFSCSIFSCFAASRIRSWERFGWKWRWSRGWKWRHRWGYPDEDEAEANELLSTPVSVFSSFLESWTSFSLASGAHREAPEQKTRIPNPSIISSVPNLPFLALLHPGLTSNPSWFNLRPISACLPASYSLVTFSGPLPQEVRRGTSSILAYPSLTSILAQPACLHPRFTCIRFSFLWLASCSSILTSLTEPEDSSERLKIDGGRGRLILCCSSPQRFTFCRQKQDVETCTGVCVGIHVYTLCITQCTVHYNTHSDWISVDKYLITCPRYCRWKGVVQCTVLRKYTDTQIYRYVYRNTDIADEKGVSSVAHARSWVNIQSRVKEVTHLPDPGEIILTNRLWFTVFKIQNTIFNKFKANLMRTWERGKNMEMLFIKDRNVELCGFYFCAWS